MAMTYLEHLKKMLGRQVRLINEEIKNAQTVDELLASGQRLNVVFLTLESISKKEEN